MIYLRVPAVFNMILGVGIFILQIIGFTRYSGYVPDQIATGIWGGLLWFLAGLAYLINIPGALALSGLSIAASLVVIIIFSLAIHAIRTDPKCYVEFFFQIICQDRVNINSMFLFFSIGALIVNIVFFVKMRTMSSHAPIQ